MVGEIDAEAKPSDLQKLSKLRLIKRIGVCIQLVHKLVKYKRFNKR